MASTTVLFDDSATVTSVGDEVALEDIDGRSLRRLRNRERVVDAYLELVTMGNRNPSVDDLAKYSGISFRSIYRYFSSTEELVKAATERGLDRFSADLDTATTPTGTLVERIDRLIEQRLDLYRRAAPFISAAKGQPFSGDIRDMFRRIRQIMAERLAAQFAPELAEFTPDERRAAVAGLYLGFLNDSLTMLHDLYDGEEHAIRAVLRDHARRHLLR
ncbi:MAG: TetR/AcrR family transcriptional regulator [Actinomycetota bacterium]